ncbi:hypothetical protein D3C83_75360 [compost metagenome]
MTHAQLLMVHGKSQEAEVWIEQGRQLIDQRSAYIQSDEERRLFRRGIKVNREILKLALSARPVDGTSEE